MVDQPKRELVAMGMSTMVPIPATVRILGVVIFSLTVLLHSAHTTTMTGARRLWHIGHATTALGIVLMYWPTEAPPMSGAVAVGFFVVAATAFFSVGFRSTRGGRELNPLWFASGVEMAAMAYMFWSPGADWLMVTYAFVLYFIVQTVAWAAGWWGRYRVAELPALAFARPMLAQATLVNTGLSGDGVASGQADTSFNPVGLSATCSPTLRVTLAVMALGMGYMLLV